MHFPLTSFTVEMLTICASAGWGSLSAGGKLPTILQKINLTSITHEECTVQHGMTNVEFGHICTYTKQGEGACHVRDETQERIHFCNHLTLLRQGDSGGPLTLNGEVVGVVNFGFPCARGRPDAFARVSYYHDWIRTTIRSNWFTSQKKSSIKSLPLLSTRARISQMNGVIIEARHKIMNKIRNICTCTSSKCNFDKIWAKTYSK